MVLATVYETAGSTYSKAGHRILIAANGDYQGLVSGGCLEGDLAERAAGVVAGRKACAVTYDLRDDADDVFGLGVGCDGMIAILLQPLEPSRGFEPFASITRLSLDGSRAVTATVVASGDARYELGDTVIWEAGKASSCNPAEPFSDGFVDRCERISVSGESELHTAIPDVEVLYSPIRSVPRLLVLGAGLDAVPIVRMAYELGWKVTIADHRPAYLERSAFTEADGAHLIDPRRLSEAFELTRFDSVLIMSHHLATDEIYLKQLAPFDFRYLGVLGPPARREKLIRALGTAGERLRRRLRGPVGLDLGPAESPEAIALSIVAELYSVVQAPLGRPLR